MRRRRFIEDSLRGGLVAATAGSALGRPTMLDRSVEAAGISGEPVIELTRFRQLFVDDYLMERADGLTRTLHQPLKFRQNPILRPDRPWEGSQVVLQPGMVLFDKEENLFKMWYESPTTQLGKLPSTYLCYATSRDGIHWEKPGLGLVNVPGSARNNIVMVSEDMVNDFFATSIIRDDLDADAGRRYKMTYWDKPHGKDYGLCVAFSADGVKWVKYPNNPAIPFCATGDWSCITRDIYSNRYLLYHRCPIWPIRKVSRLVSDDFIHWRDDRLILEPDADDPVGTEFYGLTPFPYEGGYLGLLWIFHQYPQLMDTQLVSSWDGDVWARSKPRSIFIHLGYMEVIYSGTSFDSSMIFPSVPLVKDNLLWFYYTGFDEHHNVFKNHSAIGLAHLRLDGFMSLDATTRGSVITRPFRFLSGSRLYINAEFGAQSPAEMSNLEALNPWVVRCKGGLAVAIEDEIGRPIPGYNSAQCKLMADSATQSGFTGGFNPLDDMRPLTGIDLQAEWEQKGGDISRLAGRLVRLKFTLTNAKLYSFQIR
jgi:hypothetical protein